MRETKKRAQQPNESVNRYLHATVGAVNTSDRKMNITYKKRGYMPYLDNEWENSTYEGKLRRYSTAPCTLPPVRRRASMFRSNS